ncbi:MAG: hypothetical protein ABR999_05790 [Methanoregula sp.]|jgi:hypothetical protein|uniref:hypothetical protein n=1 Tax=Methanoregula sp. TaxID=2052170 RepID=UPI003D142C1E
MADIRNFIGFAQNETLIKEYDGFRMYFPVKAKVSLAVTSKRLISYSSVRGFFDVKTESLYQQVSLADIKGVGVVHSTRSRVGLIAFAIVILLAGILTTVIGLTGNRLLEFGGIACSILGVILLLAGIFWKKHLFRFEVWGTAWVLSIGEFENIRPVTTGGPDLLKVVEELGALLIEIQEGTL